jgi:hypothetical protein
MKHLPRDKVEDVIRHADANELDGVTGILVRLSREQLSEFKALLWLGKDMDSPKHWDALVIEARETLDGETPRFLANSPNLASSLRKGLESLEAAGRI